MANRILLTAAITTALIAGCSQTTEKPQLDTGVVLPEINQPVMTSQEDTDLLEVSASANAATTPTYRPIKLPPVQPNRRQVSFAIGNDVTTEEAAPASGNYRNGVISGTANNLAPTYPDRPIPGKGTTRQEVLATIGSPPSKLPGTAGSEVWDYGTFRVFFKQDIVAFTSVW